MLDSLYIFGVSALGAGVVAYVFFGPSPAHMKQLRSSRNATIRGLQNVKNNCFINSILQSMAASQSLVTWLNCANITARQNGKLIQQIATLINKINQNNNLEEEVLTPQGVLNALREHRWVFSNEEQDAYELFNVLTTTLENELKHYSFIFSIQEMLFSGGEESLLSSSSSSSQFHQPPESSSPMSSLPLSSQLLNNHLHQHTISTRALGRTTVVGPQHLNNSLPTRGILANHLICRRCAYKYPLHLDVFDSITLSLPPISSSQTSSSSSIPLESCLSKFVRSELIDDFHCEACHTRATFDKKVEFIKLPKLLCFHVQRLVWLSGERPLKRFDHLRFPERLQMDPFTYKYVTRAETMELGGNFSPQSNPSLGSTISLAGLVGGKDFFSNGGDAGGGGGEAVHNGDHQLASPLKSSSPSSSSSAPAKLTSQPLPSRYQYLLSSVIVHLGNSSSGHFICYRRKSSSSSLSPPPSHQSSPSSSSSFSTTSSSKWYLTSDISVREVSEKEVFSASAYMLFYERVVLL